MTQPSPITGETPAPTPPAYSPDEMRDFLDFAVDNAATYLARELNITEVDARLSLISATTAQLTNLDAQAAQVCAKYAVNKVLHKDNNREPHNLQTSYQILCCEDGTRRTS